MKLIRTEDAVGSVLCHDLTQIIKGVTKDAVFRKGHVVQPEDIPVLLSIGKEHLYVWEADENMLHENDAARILCDICKNTMMDESPVKEGKIELAAAADGLFKVERASAPGEQLRTDDDCDASRQYAGEEGRQALRYAHYSAGYRKGKDAACA